MPLRSAALRKCFSFESGVLIGEFVCRTEQDANLLANRIALLKQEELRTRKKIEET